MQNGFLNRFCVTKLRGKRSSGSALDNTVRSLEYKLDVITAESGKEDQEKPMNGRRDMIRRIKSSPGISLVA